MFRGASTIPMVCLLLALAGSGRSQQLAALGVLQGRGLFGGFAAPTLLPSGCVVRVGAAAALAATLADNLGVARLSAAVPAAPVLVGLPLTAQAISFDPSGSALPGVAVSNGLLLVLGR